MNTYSIKRQTIVAVIAGSVLVLFAGSVFLDVMIGFELQKMFDTTLLDKARALETLTEQDRTGVEFEFADEVMGEFEDENDPQFFQLWLNDNVVKERSHSLGSGNLPRLQTPLNQHSFVDITLPDGRPGRLIEIVFNPRIDVLDEKDIREGKDDPQALNYWPQNVERQRATLVVARERVSLQNLRFANRVIIAGAMLSVLLVLAILIKKFVSSGLLPLDQLAAQVRRVDERSLHSRIMHEGAQAIELAPIEQQINRLLERLEAVFQREKRFSSDVAHELRTPLAELKSLAEVGSIKLDDPQITQAFFDDVKSISAQMERLVTSLLGLARADADLLRVHAEEISLAALVDSAWTTAANDLFKDKQFKNEIPADLRVRTDAEKLEVILRNLLGNAASYSPPKACVRIWAIHGDEGVELNIENPTVDLEAADICLMRERFWRKEQARSPSSGHAGLGLALVEALAGTLELQLGLGLNEENLFYATLRGLRSAGDGTHTSL